MTTNSSMEAVRERAYSTDEAKDVSVPVKDLAFYVSALNGLDETSNGKPTKAKELTARLSTLIPTPTLNVKTFEDSSEHKGFKLEQKDTETTTSNSHEFKLELTDDHFAEIKTVVSVSKTDMKDYFEEKQKLLIENLKALRAAAEKLGINTEDLATLFNELLGLKQQIKVYVNQRPPLPYGMQDVLTQCYLDYQSKRARLFQLYSQLKQKLLDKQQSLLISRTLGGNENHTPTGVTELTELLTKVDSLKPTLTEAVNEASKEVAKVIETIYPDRAAVETELTHLFKRYEIERWPICNKFDTATLDIKDAYLTNWENLWPALEARLQMIFKTRPGTAFKELFASDQKELEKNQAAFNRNDAKKISRKEYIEKREEILYRREQTLEALLTNPELEKNFTELSDDVSSYQTKRDENYAAFKQSAAENEAEQSKALKECAQKHKERLQVIDPQLKRTCGSIKNEDELKEKLVTFKALHKVFVDQNQKDQNLREKVRAELYILASQIAAAYKYGTVDVPVNAEEAAEFANYLSVLKANPQPGDSLWSVFHVTNLVTAIRLNSSRAYRAVIDWLNKTISPVSMVFNVGSVAVYGGELGVDGKDAVNGATQADFEKKKRIGNAAVWTPINIVSNFLGPIIGSLGAMVGAVVTLFGYVFYDLAIEIVQYFKEAAACERVLIPAKAELAKINKKLWPLDHLNALKQKLAKEKAKAKEAKIEGVETKKESAEKPAQSDHYSRDTQSAIDAHLRMYRNDIESAQQQETHLRERRTYLQAFIPKVAERTVEIKTQRAKVIGITSAYCTGGVLGTIGTALGGTKGVIVAGVFAAGAVGTGGALIIAGAAVLAVVSLCWAGYKLYKWYNSKNDAQVLAEKQAQVQPVQPTPAAVQSTVAAQPTSAPVIQPSGSLPAPTLSAAPTLWSPTTRESSDSFLSTPLSSPTTLATTSPVSMVSTDSDSSPAVSPPSAFRPLPPTSEETSKPGDSKLGCQTQLHLTVPTPTPVTPTTTPHSLFYAPASPAPSGCSGNNLKHPLSGEHDKNKLGNTFELPRSDAPLAEHSKDTFAEPRDSFLNPSITETRLVIS